MSHRSQACYADSYVKHVHGVDEEETPFLLIDLSEKESIDIVYCALNPSLEARTELRTTVCVFCLGVGYFQNEFCK